MAAPVILKEETSPLSLFGRSGSREVPEVEGECQVCFEIARLPCICPCFTAQRGCCAGCLRRYFTTLVQDALYAMPIIRCPLCRLRVPTAAWAPWVDRYYYDKYVGNASALLSMRCPSCDSTTSFASVAEPLPAPSGSALGRARRRAAELRSELQREELWCDLLAAREKALRRARGEAAQECVAEAEEQATNVAKTLVESWQQFLTTQVSADEFVTKLHCAKTLVESWQQFLTTQVSADEFVTKLHCAWPPGKGARPCRSLRRAAKKRAPLCIEDPERRIAAQLAWLRMYPKVRTPCCSAAVCFKCKVRGWHQHVTCEERQRQETGRDAQYCPNCQVPTTRSDGCTQIRCVCGTEWSWQEREDGPGPVHMGVHDDDDFEDESDGSEERPHNMCELLRRQTALELACMNPKLTNAKVIDLLAKAPELKRGVSRSRSEQEATRRPSDAGTAPTAGYPAQAAQAADRCPDGHRLEEWGSTRSSSWVCDGCQEQTTAKLRRFRCEACDFDLCVNCYFHPEESEASSGEHRNDRKRHSRRSLGVRGRALRDPMRSFGPSRAGPPGRSRPSTSSRIRLTEVEDTADSDAEEAGHARPRGAEAAASSSEVPPRRPELWEALEDMAGALNSFRGHERDGANAADATHDAALADAPDVPSSRERSASSLPLHYAVRSGNVRIVESLLKWSPPTEAALEELLKLPKTERLRMEEVLAPHLSRMNQRSLPLCARIHRGLAPEDSSLSFSQVLGTLPFIALRRQSDPGLREQWSQKLREVLGNEWFEAANREALTEELREELLRALRRPLDVELVRELLLAGADLQETTSHGRSGDGESVEEDESVAKSEASVGSISPWCPVPEAARSCGELLAMRGNFSEEMASILTPGQLLPENLRRRQRLLKIAIWSCNTVLVRQFFSEWGNQPLHISAWRAFRYMTDLARRTEMEELLLLFVAQRSLETVEVPLWALIQIGRKSMGADKAKAPPELKQKVASTAAMMHLEACSKLEAAFAAEDPSAFPMDALAAIHKCADPETRSAFQAIVSACKSERRPSTLSSLMRRSKRAASQELLWELRRALCEKRTPDMALAARLLESGATMRPREGSEESSDDEEGRPGGPRFSTDFDEMPRNGLDLLALNRFADPKQLDFAINKAVEYQADVNQSGYEKPLTLAVRGRNLAAVNALLHLGATVDKQALSALRTISDRPVREEMEDKFLAAVNRGECSPQLKQLKDVSLWILVQSGNVKAAKKRLHEPGGVPVDAGVLLALRRCRDANTKEELRRLLVEKVGERSVTVAESQAATYELVTEMREAFLDERDPQEELIHELILLGANTQARGVDYESYILDLAEASDSEVSESDSSGSGSHLEM